MRRFKKRYLLPALDRLTSIPAFKELKHKIIYSRYKAESNEIAAIINDAKKVLVHAEPKPFVGIVDYYQDYTARPVSNNNLRYINFLEYNSIPFEVFNISGSDWLNIALRYDIIVWGIMSHPARLEEGRTKIYILEKQFGKLCLPSFDNAYLYEDKVMQYEFFKMNGLPVVPTFVSYNSQEVKQFAETCKYPLVSKIRAGSGSRGVDIITNKKKATQFANRVFGSGRGTYHVYLKQKDYVYWQEYVPDAEFDLRVIVVGNKIFGYYRMKPKRDFRASGAGLYVKKDIPMEAVRIAIECRDKMNAVLLGVDMIKSKTNGKYLIIEASIFFGVETAEQLKVNGVPGYYHHSDGSFTFVEGRYWVQDLALAEVINRWQRKS